MIGQEEEYCGGIEPEGGNCEAQSDDGYGPEAKKASTLEPFEFAGREGARREIHAQTSRDVATATRSEDGNAICVDGRDMWIEEPMGLLKHLAQPGYPVERESKKDHHQRESRDER